MSRTVVIHQPDFLPWLGFFDRLAGADVFIVLDHVRLSKRGWAHRDRIKTKTGAQWITLPIRDIGHQPAIGDAVIVHNREFRKMLSRIEAAYLPAAAFDSLFPGIRDKVCASDRLLELNLSLLKLLFEWLGLRIEVVRSSELRVGSAKSQMNADLVRAVGGDRYISGQGARDYHEQEPFDAAGIEVVWQEFDHPVYSQLHGAFVPHLSIIDVLFNCGIEGTLKLLGEKSA